MKESSQRKSRILTLFLVLIFLAGLSLLLYPAFSDWWNSLHQSRAIASYVAIVESLDNSDNEALWEEAQAYNASLAQDSARFLPSQEEQKAYNALLNPSGTGVMGYVEIPSIHVLLPIYHGTDEAVLQIAAGHVEGSSLPVGGSGTHCVISGHRGLPSARLFTDLDQLEEGDTFSLHVLDAVLTYQVDQIRVVEPEDLSCLGIEEGEDYCTLVTCTPYGVNTHRLLVRGRRVENPAQEDATAAGGDVQGMSPQTVALAVCVPLLAVALLVGGALIIRKKRKKPGGEKH